MDATTLPVKYVFLDIVSFTEGRSVEAQAEIVGTINEIVRDTLQASSAPRDQVILLPTGDGLCIAILNVEDPFDIHLSIATDVLRRLAEYNDGQKDNSRKFEVRIGVNANLDNIVTDVNGNRNVAGAGINMAARIMTVADGGQVLVGPTVFEVLRYREKYIKKFRSYTATVKHGVRLQVHQLISDAPGLNTKPPRAFVVPRPEQPKLSKLLAYYFAVAIKHEAMLLAADDIPGAVLWLWYTARDLEASEQQYANARDDFRTFGAPQMPPSQQLDYYCSLVFDVRWELAEMIWEKHLDPFYDDFEPGRHGRLYYRPNASGRDRLKNEWPEIFVRFGLTGD